MNASPTERDDRLLRVLTLALLGAFLLITTRAWDAPILDRHEFRQLQTALSAHWIRAEGLKLDYETPLFGPPWSIPMEFPAYQAIVAGLSAATGSSLETAGRAVSLGMLLLTLPAVHGLGGLLGLAGARRLLPVAALLATPTYLFYARTVMIETTALCGAAWFAYATARAARTGSLGWAAAAVAAGLLASLAKVTTFLLWLPPAALLAAWVATGDRAVAGPGMLRRLAAAAVPAAVALGTGWAWVRHADVLKHSNPYSGFLTSTELARWNWGSLEQRLSGRFWSEFWSNVSSFVLGEVALTVLVLGLVLAPASRRLAAAACAAAFLGGTLLFSNLFYFHDYYYCANAALLALGGGLVLAHVWGDARLPRTFRFALVAAFFAGQGLIHYRGYADYLRRDPPATPGLAAVVRAVVPPNDVVLIHGWDWNALLPYYSERRAVMVPHGREDETKVLEDVVGQLPPRRISALVVQTEALRGSPSFVRWRTQRFGLAPAPVARSPHGDLYLARELMPAARAALAGRSFAGVELDLGGPGADDFPATEAVAGDVLASPVFSPGARAGRTRFGMQRGETEGRPVVLAHAPSELEFSPPAGADVLRVAFGLVSGAYADPQRATDGVEVEIFERLPDGQRRPLLRRRLDPRRVAADRGLQEVELSGIGPFSGTVVARFTNGSAGNPTNDWTYWARFELR